MREGRIQLCLLLTFFAMVGVGCATRSSPAGPPDLIPIRIVRDGEQFIESRVGRCFFRRCFTFDWERSEYRPPNQWCIDHPGACLEYLNDPHYALIYEFRVPGAEHVDELAWFHVDVNGDVIFEPGIHGVPDCTSNPVECEFNVTEGDALVVADEAGLEEGICGWGTSFHWFAGDLQSYVWTVSNCLTETSGRGALIDGNSGELIHMYWWMIIGGEVRTYKEPIAPNIL